MAILSLYLKEPQFQGQTKEKLGNPETTAQIDGLIRTAQLLFGLSGPGRGVILMRLDTDDRLIGATTIAPGAGVTVVNKDGKDRKIPLRDIPLGRRAGKGQRVVKRSVLAGMHSGVVEREV